MMITKYLADATFRGTIKKTEVTRETDASVWLGTRRRAKRSDYDNYFDTWEEARDFVVRQAAGRVNDAQRRLDFAAEELNRARSLAPGDAE